MEEGTSFQPFEAHCDGFVALISTSLFESDGWLLVFLKSTVRIPQQPRGFRLQSKLCLQLWRAEDDMTRAEPPKLLVVLYPAGTKFPAQKFLCLP